MATHAATAAHGTGSCPNCRSQNLVGVELALADGTARFQHCRRCEHRWWTNTVGGGLGLADVLARVR